MKHIFVVNPIAGAKNSTEEIREKLSEYTDYDITVYETEDAKAATEYIRDYCKTHTDEPVRFYACGGDGTINEVADGIYGFSHASMSCYPCGSGNDYVRYYGGKKRFLDLKALMDAPDEEVDLMRIGDRVSVNVVNFGFDTVVARTMNRVRRKRIIGGKNSYPTGIVYALFKGMKTKCTVTADGEVLNPSGVILLCTVAHGQYVGSGFRCAPRSDNKDGMIEVCLVKPVSRLRFLSLIAAYRKGTHLDDPRFEKFVTYKQVKSLHIEAEEGFGLTIDGELADGSSFDVEVLPRAVRFAVPGLNEQKNESASETVCETV